MTLHHTRRAADYTQDMLGEAKTTTDVARAANSIMLAEQRTWLDFHVAFLGPIEDMDTTHDHNGLAILDAYQVGEFGLPIRLRISNLGTVPATETQFFASVIVGTKNGGAYDPAKEVELSLKEWANGSGVGFGVVFPNGGSKEREFIPSVMRKHGNGDSVRAIIMGVRYRCKGLSNYCWTIKLFNIELFKEPLSLKEDHDQSYAT